MWQSHSLPPPSSSNLKKKLAIICNKDSVIRIYCVHVVIFYILIYRLNNSSPLLCTYLVLCLYTETAPQDHKNRLWRENSSCNNNAISRMSSVMFDSFSISLSFIVIIRFKNLSEVGSQSKLQPLQVPIYIGIWFYPKLSQPNSTKILFFASLIF